MVWTYHLNPEGLSLACKNYTWKQHLSLHPPPKTTTPRHQHQDNIFFPCGKQVSSSGCFYNEFFCLPISLLLELIYRCLIMHNLYIYESSLKNCFEICFEIVIGWYTIFNLLKIIFRGRKRRPQLCGQDRCNRMCDIM